MNITEQIQRAETLMSEGNIQEAKALYTDLCRMEHLTVAERGLALFGLGTCFFLAEAHDTAKVHLRESWELLVSAFGIKDPITTGVMVLLSRTLIALGELQSGMEIGHGALENLVELYGKDAQQTATAAFFLSSGSLMSGRLAEAEELIVLAMNGWEKLYGHDSLQVATCLDALGKLRILCNEKREGTDFYRQALDIKLKVLGDHEMTALSLGETGLAEALLENWEEAADLLSRSLECFEKLGVDANAGRPAVFREKLALCRKVLARESRSQNDE